MSEAMEIRKWNKPTRGRGSCVENMGEAPAALLDPLGIVDLFRRAGGVADCP